MRDGFADIHYYFTQGRSLKSARFKPAYTNAEGRILTRRERGDKPWTGRVPLEPGLLFAGPLELRNKKSDGSGTLAAASFKQLNTLRESVTHHIF